MVDLRGLRNKLDRVDQEFIQLIAKRMNLVQKIGEVKSTKQEIIRDAKREREVMAGIEKIAREEHVSVSFARKIYREIMNYSLAQQAKEMTGKRGRHDGKRLTVVYQGVENSYSYLSANAYFGEEAPATRFVGERTFRDAIVSLTTGGADYAVLPIENTTAGSINEVYDLLLSSDVYIVGEEIWKVEHCLIGYKQVSLDKIKKVISHPQALAQCTIFLRNLPNASIEGYFDTAGAVKKVAKDKNPYLAAVGSPESAEALNLHVLRSNITNQDENYTRFVVLAKSPVQYDVRIPCKTSIVFSLRHAKGSLLDCLQVLAKHNLSMVKLESRPRINRPWEYLFYLDFEGNLASTAAAKAMEEMKLHVLYMKVLGSYPSKAVPSEAVLTSTGIAEPEAAPKERPKSLPVIIKSKNYKLVTRDHQAEDTLIRVGDILIGQLGFVVMAGPCSVESYEQIESTARYVKEHGAHILRGGVFKPRTSPYSFQGLGWEGLTLLYEAGKQYGLPIITEVLSPEQVKGVAEKADILQIGARNMQNFALLREVGKVNRPVLLKRGLSSTLEELLAAAEYIVAQGNGQVILCERGIRTFETATRNTLDLSAIPVLAERTHLPVIVDPSHGTGNRRYVAPMSVAAKAVGSHGLLLEVHPDPDHALSDGDQSITFQEFSDLMKRL